jgi:hypothetical protein
LFGNIEPISLSVGDDEDEEEFDDETDDSEDELIDN